MLLKHYSPIKPLILVEDILTTIKQIEHISIAILSLNISYNASNIIYQERLSVVGDLEEAAQHFYSVLQRSDQSKSQLIIAEKMPDTGLGKTINDRLERASK